MAGRISLAVRGVKRVTPLVMEAYRRWDRLPPHEKERHKERIRQAAKQASERVRRGR
ncbi:MAG: hypothetical protein ACJ760_09160 [Thermoleophilaceae bacterium]